MCAKCPRRTLHLFYLGIEAMISLGDGRLVLISNEDELASVESLLAAGDANFGSANARSGADYCAAMSAVKFVVMRVRGSIELLIGPQ